MKNSYYLVARNRKNNELSIIPIKMQKQNELEVIDLYTISFEDEKDLAQALFKKGLIGSKDVDIFIANQKKVDGKTVLKKQEVLYKNNQRVKNIALAFLKNTPSSVQEEIDQVLDHFAYEMRSNKYFWDMVVSDKTNIYQKYAKYFTMSKINNPQRIKYLDGGWARTSYPLIRNIMETETRQIKKYETLENDMYREIASPTLKRITSPNYDENQISVFDGILEEEKKREDKLVEVISVLDSLPKHTFLIEEQEKKASFNSSRFVGYEGNDLILLQTNLPERMRYTLQLLALHKDAYQESSDYSSNGFQVPIKVAHKKMIEMLNNRKTLEDAYEWCKIYLKYQEKSLGDKNGIQYKKS